MSVTGHEIDTHNSAVARRAMIVGIVLNAIGPLGVWSMPLILAAFGHSLALNNTGAGMLASAALTGACIMALLQAMLFRVLPQRALAMACFGALLLAYSGLAMPLTFASALCLMFLLGLGMGGLLVLSLNAAEASEQISRVSAAGLVSQAGISAAIAWVVSHYVGEQADHVLVALLVTITAASLVVLPWVPKGPSSLARRDRNTPAVSSTIVIALIAWGFANFAAGGFWPLTERIGAANGISASEIGQAIAYSSLAGIAGGGAAMLLGRAFDLPIAILVIGIGTAATLGGVVTSTSAAGFALAMISFGFLWNFGPPYQLPVISETDGTGNGMAWAILFMKVSMAAGPLAYGPLADAYGFRAAGLLAIATSIVSAGLFLAVLAMKRSEAGQDTHNDANPCAMESDL